VIALRRFLSLAALALPVAVLVGCGGGSSDSDQITSLLRDFYEHPRAGQCDSSTTDGFRATVYGGSGEGALVACREHQEGRAEMAATARTAFVDNVRVEGAQAAAEVRAGGMTLTDSLVKRHGEWRLDDEDSPFSQRNEVPSPVTPEGQAPGALAFGQSASFHGIPGVPPATSISVTAEAPIEHGVDRRGERSGEFQFGDDFGVPGKPQRVRFVNVPVKLTNDGQTPFRGDVEGFGFDAEGHQFVPLNPRDIGQSGGVLGRLPDWTSGEEKGIAAGASTTRYLTFAIPAQDQIVKWVLKPSLLIGPGSVSSLEPLEGATYAPGAGEDLPRA
jgi:hypothetical protein